jgi:hypothetical protein
MRPRLLVPEGVAEQVKERSDGAAAHALWIVLGGMVLIALPVAWSLVFQTYDFGPAMIASVSIATLAGPAVASTMYRLLRPDAVIYEELVTGDRFVVERSMKARRVYAAIALAIYAVVWLLAVV